MMNMKKVKKPLKVTREMKIDILEKLAESMYTFSAYPTDNEYEKVAKALVMKHPCLSEPGPGTGWQGWKVSLKFKMANYRQKLRSTGCSEVQINKRQRGKQGGTLKKPKRAEINFLPDFPTGLDEAALEGERMWLEEELRKKNVNLTQVDDKMDLTFSLRGREVISDQPPVTTIRLRWPALFLEQQVYAEFKRITGVELNLTFHKSLEVNAKGLIAMYRSRRGDNEDELKAVLTSLDEQTTDIPMHRRSAALRGLQFYLRENITLVKTIQRGDDVERQTRGMQIGLLETGIDAGGLDSVVDVAVVVEEEVLLNVSHVPTAFGVLFGLLYTLYIDYPKQWKYLFEAVQKVFMGLDSEKCSARIQSLRTKLLQV
ncbi:sterile alpha motif domain-containing protein 3-like [Siphateles boraxobius]|uniref:sterile alpha motif domain-containing protein 3-like n=1 Tax=Siphateles boraxobius TaxID=180520 RepID=UPI004062BE40